MNLNQRRPTGTHSNPMLPCRTKADFMFFCKEHNVTVLENREDGWHNFYVIVGRDKYLAGSFAKGERRDWQDMWNYTLNLTTR